MALMPMLGRLRVLRSWGGIMDMSMDGSPIIDKTPIDGLYLNCGWCYGGFKATPASGWCFAHLMATDEPHEVAEAYPPRPLRDRPADRRERRRRAAQPALTDTAMRIPCPHCGPRDHDEFVYSATPRCSGPIPRRPAREPAFCTTTSTCATTRRACTASCGITRAAAASGWW